MYPNMCGNDNIIIVAIMIFSLIILHKYIERTTFKKVQNAYNTNSINKKCVKISTIYPIIMGCLLFILLQYLFKSQEKVVPAIEPSYDHPSYNQKINTSMW